MSTKILCFDLDDTLIDDSYKFEITFCDCIKTILLAFETKAPQIDEILQLARQLDNDKLLSWPAERRYSPERLLSTWLDTYQKLCQLHNVEAKPHVNLILEGLVMQNFDPPYFVIPGAIETLEALKEQGIYQLRLLTVGTEAIQSKKIHRTGLNKFFQEIHFVVDGDKKAVLSRLADEYGIENITMVGNSIRSDINPALEVGVRAVYIPRGSWHMFRAEPINQLYSKLSDIAELPKLI